jgi:chemotaxis protein MotB
VQYLTLGSDATFQTGSDVLSRRGRRLVRGLSETIVGTSSAERIHSLVEIQVGGHTDDVPITTPRFPSNWELSTARATRVVKSLVEAGIDPSDISMSATGYAEFDPRSSNRSNYGRARNRRIEMRLIYTDDEARQR